MAINSAIAKILLTLAKQVVTDKKARQRILIALSLPVMLLLVIISSPFAILFGTSGETTVDSGKPIIEIMQELHAELQTKIQAEKNVGNDISEVKIIYMGSEGEPINNAGHVIALFSVKCNMVESEDAQQVASLTESQVKALKNIYWEMNTITTEIVSIPWDEYGEENPQPRPKPTPTSTPNPSSSPTPTPSPTPEPIKIKYIYVTCLSYLDVLDDYNFNEYQLLVLNEMMAGEYAYLFASVTGNTSELTPQEIKEILDSLPNNLTIEREAMVLAAYSLVGKVKYFWGGKSNAIGWDSSWGEMRLVTSEGSQSTGTYRPYGLDCSGYVRWVYLNSGFPPDVINNSFGSGTSKQWNYSVPVTTATVMPGDLAFKCVPGTAVNHVGVLVGYDTDGTLMVAHCSSSNNCVVVTPFSPTFKYLRRPVILTESEVMP